MKDNLENALGLFNEHAMLIRATPQGVITFVNERFCEITKFSPEEVIGKDYQVIYRGVHTEEFLLEIWKTINAGNIWFGPMKNRSKEGVEFWVNATVRPIIDKDGSISEFVAINQHITTPDSVWQNSSTLETLLKNFPAAIHETIINENGTMTYVSPYMTNITGYPHTDFINDNVRSFLSIVHPEDVKDASKEFVRHLDSSIPYSVRYRIYNSKGEIRWINERGAQSWEEGKVVGAMFDITEEVEIKQTMEAMRRAIDKTAIIAFTDERGVITWVNDKFCQISKYPRKEIIGKTHTFLNSGYHPKGFFKELWETIKTGQSWQGEIKNKAKDGTYYWVDTTIAPIMDGKKVRKYVAFRRDITDQKYKEMLASEISQIRSRFIKLSGNRKKFFNYLLQKVIELTESGYGFIGEIIEGEEGRYLKTFSLTDISWNEETRKLYQDNLLTGMVFKNPNTLFGVVLTTGEPIIANKPSEHKSSGGIPPGHPPLNAFMGVPIYYSDKLIAMIGVANRPNGYSKKMYDDLSVFFEAIGETIHAFFMEEELQNQKNIMMHNARLASIGQLAAGVGHEINNPLAIIAGYLAMTKDLLLDKGISDPQILDMFDKIKGANIRIANIVKGLRTFARADESSSEPFDVKELLEETLSMITDIYKKDGAHITYHGMEAGRSVKGNRGRIQQVLVNILANAKDATIGRENRQIHVKTFSLDGKIKISISDNGEGIPDEIKEKIFDPFFTTKDVNQGTGIGLSLVNSIVKEHDGHVEVKSKKGQGATFTITLPEFTNLRLDILGPSKSKKSGDVWIGGTVLIVDDEPEIKRMLDSLMQKSFDKVFVAGSVEEATRIVAEVKVDIIISDIKMPGTDGIKFYKRLESTSRLTKFVFISGGVSLNDEELAFIEKRKIPVIHKPFSEEILLESLRDLE